MHDILVIGIMKITEDSGIEEDVKQMIKKCWIKCGIAIEILY